MLTVITVPLPGLLFTVNFPFIRLTKLWVMAMPSPVPEIFLLLSELKRVYSSNSILICSSVMPCPVSLTRIIRSISVAVGASPYGFPTVKDSVTSPASVYLKALDKRLFKICLMRSSSPIISRGISSATSKLNLIGLCWNRIVFICAASLIRLEVSYLTGINSSFPASILDKSRISFTRFSRSSPELYIFSNPS